MASSDIIADSLDEAGIRRKRLRKNTLRIDRKAIADRVVQFYTDDIGDRTEFLEDRIQRYAKYRMWTERNDLPWEDASDVSIPDMMTDSLRLQDTLHNAVMAITPPITSKALNPEEREKEDTVDNLIHHQHFVDTDGEGMVGDMSEAFVNDGFYVIYNPWIVEEAKIFDIRVHDPIPGDQLPMQYFQTLIELEFPRRSMLAVKEDEEGWDWAVPEDRNKDIKVKFYTRKDNRVEMTMERMETVFDGPKPTVKDIDDVFFPWRAANLQAPTPSNPNGASHVILRDFPTVDEIARLQKSGYYDQIKPAQIKDLEQEPAEVGNQEMKNQKDDFQGTAQNKFNKEAKSHNRLTRLVCFDRFDIDGDGLDEDVIFWVIKEKKMLLRARRLTEMFPSNPPRRPLISESMIPVKDRVVGIGLLEMMEGLHDAIKETADQTVDSGTLSNSPFFFYKPTSSLNPEIFTVHPGEGIPVGDPKNDINFPNINTQGQAFGLNMMTIFGQMSERLTMTSDLQRGQVPAGKSSALRTHGGIQAILSQGEARPERILRRFFKGMAELYHQTHEMNQRLLPENKKILISKNLDVAEDPYQTINDKTMIKGRFQFNFNANILNTSKAAMQEALGSIMQVGLSELTLQTGIINQNGIYRLIRDFTKAWGQEPNDYFNKPSPQADLQPITTEEAMLSITNGVMPGGMPIGGWVQHLQELQVITQSPEFGAIEDLHVELLGQYIQIVTANAQQELQQQRMIQAARNFQASQQAQGDGQGGAAPDMSNQQLSNNELIDENLQ